MTRAGIRHAGQSPRNAPACDPHHAEQEHRPGEIGTGPPSAHSARRLSPAERCTFTSRTVASSDRFEKEGNTPLAGSGLALSGTNFTRQPRNRVARAGEGCFTQGRWGRSGPGFAMSFSGSGAQLACDTQEGLERDSVHRPRPLSREPPGRSTGSGPARRWRHG